MLKKVHSWINSTKHHIGKVFEAVPLSEIIRQEVEKAVTEKMQAERVIKNHRFIQHMAEAKIKALDEWSND